jgi:hypothetical protein
MKVCITGLTELTIVFNSLNIVLRGMQTAKGVKVETDEQKAELIQLRDTGMIDVDALEEPKPAPAPKRRRRSRKKAEPKVEQTEGSEEKAEEEAGEKTEEETAKKSTGKSTKKSGPKTVKRASKKQDDVEVKDDVVVMTPGGAVKGRMVNKAVAGQENESKVAASLEAAEKLEQEENEEGLPENERELDASEKMGGQAVIATGEGESVKVDLKNSVLPEADTIKDRDPFIDEDLGNLEDENEAFIDKDDILDDDGEEFIEH